MAWSCALSWSFAHSYICACPWTKNFSNQAALGPDVVEHISMKPLDGFIPFEVLCNCLDLQLCNIMVISPWPWIFKVNFWKCCLYLRNGSVYQYGTKGIWVERMLDPHCDFEHWPHAWPWPLIFKVKFWKSRNSGMGCPIDKKRKGCDCESTECWTHVVTLNFDLTPDLDHEFSTSNFEIAVSQEWEGRSPLSEKAMSR